MKPHRIIREYVPYLR